MQFSEKDPRFDQSCADCPGFPVLGAGDAPPPELHPGAPKCAPGLAFALMALRANSWICCPQLPYHPCKNRTHSTCFCGTRGHAPKFQGWPAGISRKRPVVLTDACALTCRVLCPHPPFNPFPHFFTGKPTPPHHTFGHV